MRHVFVAARSLACAIAVLLLAGCASVGPIFSASPPPVTPVVQNPLFVPVTDREFVWNQLVDAVDDYFKIAREERVREADGVLLEGRIDTLPAIGSTILEPWRNDATPGFEKLHGTLQSIRRIGQMRVIPSDGGYLLELAVYKQLEDLPQPEQATMGGMTYRRDNTLVRNAEAEFGENRGPVVAGWIPLGRDVSLEQRMLADIQSRLTNVQPPAAVRWPFGF